LARDCQETEERCYRCNDTGHKSRECDREKDQISCYNCKERGHLVRDCPTKVEICFACNLEGHISRKIKTIIYINFINHTFVYVFQATAQPAAEDQDHYDSRSKRNYFKRVQLIMIAKQNKKSLTNLLF
jgi:hypothetical protein